MEIVNDSELRHPVSDATEDAAGREAVAVIHGLGSNRLFMSPLVWRIRGAGFNAVNFGYASFFKSISEHADSFGQVLDKLDQDPRFDRWHIVAHSLGSIVTRHLLSQQDWSRLGRVLLLAPPNLGSPAATRLSRLLPLSQTVRQISHRPESFVNQLSPAKPLDHVQFGVISASYDFVVSAESSRLPFEHQHLTVFSGHNGLLVRKRAAEETIHFLRHGRFTVSEIE